MLATVAAVSAAVARPPPASASTKSIVKPQSVKLGESLERELMAVRGELVAEPVERAVGRAVAARADESGRTKTKKRRTARAAEPRRRSAVIGLLAFGCACATRPKPARAAPASTKPRALVPQTAAVL